MKTSLTKYIKHSCITSLILGLLGVSVTQIAAAAATCKNTQVSSCENVKFVLSPKKDCTKYYEVTSDVSQCMQKDDSHQCTTGKKLKCTPPKAE
ncbi:MAG: hypothetical protein K0R14_1811 [Burkholderiales bacterium]|jgi:hypothetical protein|nr:hypothetical protein [Burkholderiales bacterium]